MPKRNKVRLPLSPVTSWTSAAEQFALQPLRCVGPMWNDNTPYNQVIPIAPFSVTNLYLNYTLRNGTRFDQTKFRLSFNNLFDNNNIVGVQQAAAGSVDKPGSADLLSTAWAQHYAIGHARLLAGRLVSSQLDTAS